jgi:hypothetical protein
MQLDYILFVASVSYELHVSGVSTYQALAKEV